MKTVIKKAAGSVLAVSVLTAMTGCSFMDKSKDEVMDCAEEFCDAIVERDLDTVLDIAGDELDEDMEDELYEALDIRAGNTYSELSAQIVEAIADTLTYEIDEDSIKTDAKKGTGKVDVTFTVVDVQQLMEDYAFEDIEDLIDEISDVDTMETEVTLKFTKDDGEWYVEDIEDVIEDAYSFMEYGLYITAAETWDTSAAFNDDYSGEYSTSGFIYIGTDEVDFDNCVAYASTDTYYISIGLVYDSSEDIDFSGYYAEVLFEGEVVACTYDDVWVDVYPDENGLIEAGTYDFMFYDANGLYIDTATVIVE